MHNKGSVSIQVSAFDIRSGNTGWILGILNSFIPNLIEDRRNKVIVEINGYNNDPRELYDISEVRRYFQKLFDDEPGLFYWFDMNSYMFLLFGLMLFKPYRHDGIVELRPEDMQQYLIYGFQGLNQFCKRNGVSPEPTNKLIKDALANNYKVY